MQIGWFYCCRFVDNEYVNEFTMKPLHVVFLQLANNKTITEVRIVSAIGIYMNIYCYILRNKHTIAIWTFQIVNLNLTYYTRQIGVEFEDLCNGTMCL